MIIGIGTDIVSIDRIESALLRFGDRFAARVLAVEEMTVYQASAAKHRVLAKRFAAKEAAAKAMGTGFRNGVCMRDIVITHDQLGRPLLQFSGKALLYLEKIGMKSSHLSISDEQKYAIAFVTLTS
ncbi:holo-ACP synthase [Solemya pervernicosa gill symbiont]|uniref:Holo-[acyl-carrier-protein] synthase n=2 Tax=Gammaproteobacteria incertae sedis TaxID=118884 RepID=A0A1T2LAJ8_9GAMM|nr:holo-ACP synthase [Candidatus Reidiella endopervernicosa]OOZ42032.1 holo-ACP synthase [Solemya pervernicosa gill symbiont]QKQ27026.1 holo-ACP synthase [Candidatus Reidiella endopervernicosa]